MTTLHLELEEELIALLQQRDSSLERSARELIVMELYRRGVLSRGRSAELLGMRLADFLDRAAALETTYFTFTVEEWTEEMRQVEREVAIHQSSPMPTADRSASHPPP